MRRAWILLLLFFCGCLGGGGDQISATSQTITNQGLEYLVSLAIAFQSSLKGADSCPPFQQALTQSEGEENCELGGTESLEISQSSCQDAPFFEGQAVLNIVYQNCRSPESTLGGSLDLHLTWDGEDLLFKISTGDFSYDGTFYSIQEFSIAVDPSGGVSCDGFLLVQGEICVPTPDCNFCPL